jgi:hypothetical protein
MAENNTEQQPITVASKLTSFIGLYAVFVYISGWAYSDSYLQSFGLSRGWIDISITETMTKGFTVLFEDQGRYLWFIYIFVVVVPVLFEVFPKLRAHVVTQLAIACLMLSCLPLDYYISQSAAEHSARIDQSDNTTLFDVFFELRCGASSAKYTGKLLYIKDGFYYLHNAKPLSAPSATCITYGETIKQSTIVRAEDIQAFQIIEKQLQR